MRRSLARVLQWAGWKLSNWSFGLDEQAAKKTGLNQLHVWARRKTR